VHACFPVESHAREAACADYLMARYDPRDKFYRKARAAGLPSRAAFKIEELIARFKLVRPGARVADLGCAPGGWLAILTHAVGPNGRVVGVDIDQCAAPGPNVVTITGDIRDAAVRAQVANLLVNAAVRQAVAPSVAAGSAIATSGAARVATSGGSAVATSGGSAVATSGTAPAANSSAAPVATSGTALGAEEAKQSDRLTSAVGAIARCGEATASVEVGARQLAVADLIASDLSPKLTGIADRDQARSAELLTIALEFAGVVLRPGGAMIAKVFMGGEFEDLKRKFDRAFDKVEVTHTRASRPGSSELYLVARGFRPG
jgi:23S rRNA U2552 (ribose-2'-O)-methylase RlmE/FtsJ